MENIGSMLRSSLFQKTEKTGKKLKFQKNNQKGFRYWYNKTARTISKR